MEHKQVLLRSYDDIYDLEAIVTLVQQSGISKLKLSILGGFKDMSSYKEEWSCDLRMYQKAYLKALLGANTDFGSFYNTETGKVIVLGFLTTSFLHLVGKKPIGELSGGPYGIIRGLGISKVEAASSVKKLNNGEYLFFARGDLYDIEALEVFLKT